MKKDLVEKIKLQLKSLFKQKFVEIKAGDMIITSQDEVLIVGSEVFYVDEDGMNVPLTDGEYKLDSGETITVFGGKVEKIVAEEVETEVETETEMEVTEEVTEEEEVKEDKMEKCDCEDRVKKLEDEMVEFKKMFKDLKSEKEELEHKFSKLAEQPSMKSIELKAKTSSNSISNDDFMDLVRKRTKI